MTALTGPLSSAGTGVSSSQTSPAFNSGSSSVVYIDTENSGNVDLIELNLSTSVARSILKSNPNGLVFNALNSPEYGFAIGGNLGVIFSGKVSGGSYHVYTVDTQSGQVAQLTFGNFDDLNPTLSPDANKPVVAFDRGPAGQLSAPRDIYVIGTNPNVQNATRITNFTAGGKSSSNIQPAWSTDKVDQPTSNQHFVRGQQLLGFASTRMDSTNNGLADAVNPNGSHEIYWLKVSIGLDPNNPSVYTVTTPESATNPAYKLSTSDPQHIYDDTYPTWPQFISTYRVAYQSDRTFHDPATNASGPAGQPTDIFASTLLDINTPALIRFDDVTGDVLRVEPRLSAPGTPVKISAKLADFESGIRDVWVQIKNPNSKYQSADNKEHKVYAFGGSLIDGPTNVVLDCPNEYDCQRIFIGDDPSNAQVGTYANPRYIPSINDYFAFSGGAAPPEAGWLKLSLESRNPTTGISTYSATWTTDRYPTDYYIDLIAYDNAANPFGTGTSNWRIYDNIWGFTTQNFVPSKGLLFVSDYSLGQKFFGGKFGTDNLTNVYNTFWGSESWLTDIDVSLHQTRYASGTNIYPVANVANTLGVKSFNATEFIVDGSQDDGTRIDGFPVPPTQTYDMWRIICRGPVPDSVLQQYMPHKEQQPADKYNGETADRTVLVSPRCVFWNAPNAGSVFAGAGTITDLTVQLQLHNFLAAGGRLNVSGQDIAWALSLGGQATNAFLTNDLKAAYVADSPGSPLSRVDNSGAFFFFWIYNAAYVLTSAPTPNPISHDPWELAGWTVLANHIYPGPPVPPTTRDFANSDANFVGSGGVSNNQAEVANLGVKYPDVVTPQAPAIADFSYTGGGTAIMHYEDATTGQRVTYFPMGLDGLNTESWVNNNIMYFKNRRAVLMHNTICWMRTGTVSGTVRDVAGGNPLADTLVRLTHRASSTGAPIYDFTALTGPDGSFTINGVTSGAYEITAVKPGYTIQRRTPVTVHGAFRDNIGLRMTVAEASVIKGKVTRLDGTTPVVGATVTATDVQNANAKFTATTDANGNYSIDRVPSQTKYTLTASAPGFGQSIPVSYLVEDTSDPSGQGLLQPAKVYEPYDFKMKPLPGSVTGFVYVNNNGTKGAPIANATVTATQGTTTVTAVTDANGAYSFSELNSPANGLDPGAWALVATAPGYAPNNPAVSVTVVSGQTAVAADILLSTVAPGSISGLVTRSSDGAAVPGVLIQLKDASGNIVASTTTTAEQTDGSGYRYNYKIANAPAGVTYTVVATKSGFTANPATRSAAVKSGEETKSVNFSMQPLHTFAANLSLVSAPYDYSGFDPVNDITGQGGLLDVPRTDAQNGTFMFATWDLGRYVFYPTPPANTFHLGRGYWLGYKHNLPLSVQGTPADTTRPFDIPLNAGWNMIGDPFTFDIDWTKVHFVENGVSKTYQEAVASGAVGSALYSYLSGTYVLSYRLQPWLGYWVRAYRNVVLRIDPTADQPGRAAAINGGTSRAVLQGGSGWSVNLRVNISDTRDEDNHFGVSSRAADGFDAFKVEKPPVFGQRYTHLTFTHPNWGDKSGGYGVDVRSAAAGTKTWEFEVQTSEARATATLAWPNTAAAPRNTTLTLTDLANNQSRDMRTSSSYSWNTGDTPTTRKFRIEMTRTNPDDTLRLTNVVVRTGGSRSTTAGVSFNLSKAANVDVRILGANGSQVRRLTGRASRAAGIHEMTWDMKSDQNVSVPSGSYTVEVRAQSTDGKSTVRQIAPFVVIR